jgi:hypothetical protein
MEGTQLGCEGCECGVERGVVLRADVAIGFPLAELRG